MLAGEHTSALDPTLELVVQLVAAPPHACPANAAPALPYGAPMALLVTGEVLWIALRPPKSLFDQWQVLASCSVHLIV